MNPLDLYTQTCFECSKIITRKYSTSFSIGIKVFEKEIRFPIYAIYGFVRFADEIVDSFHHTPQENVLKEFKKHTFQAIEEKMSMNPVLHAFQHTVHQFNIPMDLINSFLYSMEMDLSKKSYELDTYNTYIYGSAEVVGLMCLKIFCAENKNLYKELIPFAQKLGAAFQKVNFLRDIKNDYEDKGRIYFPEIQLEKFDENTKNQIINDIQSDFDTAYNGILQLPNSARQGVIVAYTYYLELLKKIKQTPAKELISARIRVSDSRKVWLLAQVLISK